MAKIKVDVKLACPGPVQTHFNGDVQTRSSTTYTDSVAITTRGIIAELQRSAAPSNPFSAHNSTFLKLITKSLALYYTLERKPSKILKISWSHTSISGKTTNFSIDKKEIIQIVDKSTNLSLLSLIDPIKAKVLMEETNKGRAVLYAITHLIKALDNSNPFERFDRLWRAFNALYKEFAKSTNDSFCHIELAKNIRLYPARYPLSIAKVAPLTKTEIRKHTRWNLMLQNNHPTPPRTKALHDAIIRTTDSRIIEIYKDTLNVRKTHLTTAMYFNAVNTHIINSLMVPQVNNSDVVITLCIKYMYFVRNKIAHAERTDSGFTFLITSSEKSEILWLTPMLEAIIIDLVNISDTF